MKWKSRIARIRNTLARALAIQATPTTEERIGDIVIRDDAEAEREAGIITDGRIDTLTPSGSPAIPTRQDV